MFSWFSFSCLSKKIEDTVVTDIVGDNEKINIGQESLNIPSNNRRRRALTIVEYIEDNHENMDKIAINEKYLFVSPDDINLSEQK